MKRTLWLGVGHSIRKAEKDWYKGNVVNGPETKCKDASVPCTYRKQNKQCSIPHTDHSGCKCR